MNETAINPANISICQHNMFFESNILRPLKVTVNFEKIRLEVDLGVTFSVDTEYTIFFPIGFMTSEI